MPALLKTVAVLGGAYGGARAAQVLAQKLPEGWRVVLIDRNSHFNHLYVLPRYAILPQHAHKAFIPYTNVFSRSSSTHDGAPNLTRQVVLHAQVIGLSEHSVTLSRSFPELGIDGDTPVLNFDYAIYALGSHLPAPINLWGPVEDNSATLPNRGTKDGGVEWLRRYHALVDEAASVLIVGGGALGIQYATDIAEVYPNKPVTLLHSRDRLLPRFNKAMHKEILTALAALNVTVILGERLDLASAKRAPELKDGKKMRIVRTQNGREISAGIVLLCTGQTPNTSMMQNLLADSIVPDGPSKGMIRVKRSMQVAIPTTRSLGAIQEASRASEETTDDGHLVVPYEHHFAVGDAADAFGAINAGHIAAHQGEVAANNIVELIRYSESTQGSKAITEGANLERYKTDPPGIKLSLGLRTTLYQHAGVVGKKDDGSDDLNAAYMWRVFGEDPPCFQLPSSENFPTLSTYRVGHRERGVLPQ